MCTGQQDWTWDAENAGQQMQIKSDGMMAMMLEEEDEDKAKWQFADQNTK
jgi:hypothetical protein